MEESSRKIAVSRLIRNHMVWSMGAGLIPMPIVDFFAVGAIQLDMIRQMCKLYDVDFREKDGRAIISSLTGAGAARLGANVIKFIPGVGSVIGGITMSVLSGASTYGVGEVFRRHFETGGTILDFDADRLKRMYDEMFEKGKELARNMKKEEIEVNPAQAASEARDTDTVSNQSSGIANSKVEQLKELAKLKTDGFISAEEYELLKNELLS